MISWWFLLFVLFLNGPDAATGDPLTVWGAVKLVVLLFEIAMVTLAWMIPVPFQTKVVVTLGAVFIAVGLCTEVFGFQAMLAAP